MENSWQVHGLGNVQLQQIGTLQVTTNDNSCWCNFSKQKVTVVRCGHNEWESRWLGKQERDEAIDGRQSKQWVLLWLDTQSRVRLRVSRHDRKIGFKLGSRHDGWQRAKDDMKVENKSSLDPLEKSLNRIGVQIFMSSFRKVKFYIPLTLRCQIVLGTCYQSILVNIHIVCPLFANDNLC